jgi:hypothetical protein
VVFLGNGNQMFHLKGSLISEESLVDLQIFSDNLNDGSIFRFVPAVPVNVVFFELFEAEFSKNKAVVQEIVRVVRNECIFCHFDGDDSIWLPK